MSPACCVERLQLLPSVQSAYRKKHSTETAVLKVIANVLRAADQGEVSLRCMSDLSSAFDTVVETPAAIDVTVSLCAR